MLTESEPGFDDITCSLKAVSKQPAGIMKEIKKVVGLARKFNREIVEPESLVLDRKILDDTGHIPVRWMEKANEWGFYTLWLPKLFGGQGYCFPSLSYFTEEISSKCVGMANIIGVHYLGLATLIATWNLSVLKRIRKDILAGEASGNPCIVSMAITEPDSGTDTPETELLDKGNVSCHAKRAKGGYIVNGTKIFISNVPMATWHIVLAFSDLKNPSRTPVWFVVKKGTKGFSTGRKENKMGQAACPASEIIFKDCFIPDDQVCLDARQLGALTMSPDKVYARIFDYLNSVTRAAVCAMGAGVGRGAYESALKFASDTKVSGKYYINHEWVQCRLADMYKNIAVSRLIYTETGYANGLYGFFKTLQFKPAYYLNRITPKFVLNLLFDGVADRKFSTWITRKLQYDWMKPGDMQRCAGWASLAKFAGSDAGMENCHLALELMGQAGLRHENRIEKHFRDAKLLQIYEGPNQANRISLFQNFIQRSCSHAVVFED